MAEDVFSFGFSESSSSPPPPPPVPDKNFVFQQLVASDTWVVNHGLGKRVSVEVTNDLNFSIGSVIEWDDDNQVTIYFNSPRTGWVYCN